MFKIGVQNETQIYVVRERVEKGRSDTMPDASLYTQ